MWQAFSIPASDLGGKVTNRKGKWRSWFTFLILDFKKTMSVCKHGHMCTMYRSSLRLKEEGGSSGTGVIGSCKLSCGLWLLCNNRKSTFNQWTISLILACHFYGSTREIRQRACPGHPRAKESKSVSKAGGRWGGAVVGVGVGVGGKIVYSQILCF